MVAALRLALSSQADREYGWLLYGGNESSSRRLREISSQLEQRIFPEATFNSMHELTLRLTKPEPPSWWSRVRRRPGRTREFEIVLLDVGGGRYGPDQLIGGAGGVDRDGREVGGDGRDGRESRGGQADLGDRADHRGRDSSWGHGGAGGELYEDTPEAGDEVERLVDHLAHADGIVYLFDPLRELTSHDSYLYLDSMLERVTARAAQLGRLRDGRLPHYLAVCINKIDDPVVFNHAYDGAFLSASDDDLMLPEITSDDAADLFQALCGRREASSGPKVRGTIETHFHAGRVRYFATTSVGFYVGPSGFFRAQDFSNIETRPGLPPRIRGEIRPSGVLEPFLWLEESIRKARPPAFTAPPPDTPAGRPDGGAASASRPGTDTGIDIDGDTGFVPPPDLRPPPAAAGWSHPPADLPQDDDGLTTAIPPAYVPPPAVAFEDQDREDVYEDVHEGDYRDRD